MLIANPAVADLFTVPASDWAAIQRRVSHVLLAVALVDEIKPMLPHFPNLLAACQQWQRSTFAAIQQQSRQLQQYAADAQRQFQPLAAAIAALDPAAALPAPVHEQAAHALEALWQATADLRARFEALKEPISDFHIVNGQVDSELLHYRDQFAFLGDSIAQSTQAVGAATGRVQGSWDAIADDLRPITAGQVDLTLALLASLGLEEALLTWASIEQEARAFQRAMLPQTT